MADVPDGTAQEVLDWVGDDPRRADAALHAEYARPSPRSTLTSKLQTIASKEAPMADDTTTTTEEPEEVEEFPAPVPPSGDDLVIDLVDQATNIGPVNVANTDVDKPDDSYDLVAAQAAADEADESLVDAASVEYFQLVSNSGVVALRFDDVAVLLDANQAAALSRDLRSALAGVTY